MNTDLRYKLFFSLTLSVLTLVILMFIVLDTFFKREDTDVNDSISVEVLNRSVPPLGATLLQGGTGLTNGAPMSDGNFQVEAYCSVSGKGGDINENGVDWFCGSTKLTPLDFDDICNRTYKISNAIAIKNGTGEKEAYKWRCYSNTSEVTPTTTQPHTTIRPTSTLYPPCGPMDCNSDGLINIIDFSCFVQKYGRSCL